MHPHAEIIAEVQAILRDTLTIEVPSADTDLVAEGLVDSLALVELLAELEQRFEIEIPIEELEIDSFQSVERIAGFVASCEGDVSALGHLDVAPEPSAGR